MNAASSLPCLALGRTELTALKSILKRRSKSLNEKFVAFCKIIKRDRMYDLNKHSLKSRNEHHS